MGCDMVKFLIAFLFIISSVSFSEDNSKINISGGMKYSDWPSGKNSVLCKVDLVAPLKTAQNRDPFLIIFLMDYWATREIGQIIDGPIDKTGLINNVPEGDYVAAISFSKTAKSISALSQINEQTKKTIKSNIRNAKTVEGTDLAGGLDKLEEQLNEIGNIDNSGKFVFLISNSKSDDIERTKNLAKIQSISEEHNVNFSTFGHYKNFNEDFMIDAALSTGGRAFFFDKNKINDLHNLINNEISRLKNSSAIDITIALDQPESIEIIPMMGFDIKEDEINIDRLESGSTNSLYFKLKNRPEKRKDIVFDLTYYDPEGVSDQNDVFYFDISILDGKKTYNPKFAPELIIYETELKLYSMTDNLLGNDKKARQQISDTLNNRILLIKEENNSLNSSMLTDAIDDFTSFRDDIRNFAIENEVIMKRIKYRLLQFSYGKKK